MAEAPLAGPIAPTRQGGPSEVWEHRDLYDRVVKALYALPWEFETDINIVGIRVTDLYTFNTALGAAIEQSVVENLNKLRTVWDPDDQYRLYRFVRQAQVFPDVRLQSVAPGVSDIIMGIELKGWFAMAKEGEPSFRYTVSPTACAPQDLLVVYPWILREVISGSPLLLAPYVEEARYAAQIRNHYWETRPDVSPAKAEVAKITATSFYPSKGALFNDKAVSDSGGNFGRVSRGGIMKEWIEILMEQEVSGIPLGAWQKFVRIFSEGQSTDEIVRRLELIRKAHPASEPSVQAQTVALMIEAIEELSATPPSP